MIEMVLAHADVARLRFAYSPVRELVMSLRILRDPAGLRVYRRWMAAVRGGFAGPNIELLTALVPAGRFMPDFLIPQPTGPEAVLDDELCAIAATPAATVRAEIAQAYEDAPLPQVLQPLHDDPEARLAGVVDEMRRYWQVAIAPVWRQLQALSLADVSYRTDRFATGGVARVLSDLHPELTLNGDRLRIAKRHHCAHRVDLAGTGIVLLPCVFAWRTLLVECCDVDQPALTYPPRGVARFGDLATGHADALGALVGRTRARLLSALDRPKSTSQLAGELDLSAGTVSEHLTILKRSALVTAQRRGRMVVYQRTAIGTALLTAAGGGAPH